MSLRTPPGPRGGRGSPASGWALEQAVCPVTEPPGSVSRSPDVARFSQRRGRTRLRRPGSSALCQASSARRDALTGLLGAFTGSPSAEGRLLAAWQAHDREAARSQIGARAATSLANWMVLAGRPDQALDLGGPGGSLHGPGSAPCGPCPAPRKATRSPRPAGAPRGGHPGRPSPVPGNEVPMSRSSCSRHAGHAEVHVPALHLPGPIADPGAPRRPRRAPGRPSTYPGRVGLIPVMPTSGGATWTRRSPTPSWRPRSRRTPRSVRLTSPGRTPGRPRSACRGQRAAAGAHVSAAGRRLSGFPWSWRWPAPRRRCPPASPGATCPGYFLRLSQARATGVPGVGGGAGIFNWRAMEAEYVLTGLGRLDDAQAALKRSSRLLSPPPPPRPDRAFGRAGPGPPPGQPGGGTRAGGRGRGGASTVFSIRQAEVPMPSPHANLDDGRRLRAARRPAARRGPAGMVYRAVLRLERTPTCRLSASWNRRPCRSPPRRAVPSALLGLQPLGTGGGPGPSPPA